MPKAIAYALLLLVIPGYASAQHFRDVRTWFSPETVTVLKDLAGREEMEELVRKYFAGRYDPNLADFVVVVQRDGDRQTIVGKRPYLIRNGHRVDDLHGARHVWILVLYFDGNLTTPRASGPGSGDGEEASRVPPREPVQTQPALGNTGYPPKPLRLSARMESLAHKRSLGESVVRSTLTALGTALGSITPVAPAEAEDFDATRVICLNYIGVSCTAESLFAGSAKFPLSEHSINRIRVAIPDVSGGGDSTFVYGTFGDYSGNRVGAALGIIVTEGRRRQSVDAGTPKEDRATVDALVLVQYDLRRPKLPETNRVDRWPTPSIGLSVGLPLRTGKLLDDVFLGIFVGHLVSDFGLVAGWNIRTETVGLQEGETPRNIRRGRFAGGLLLSF